MTTLGILLFVFLPVAVVVGGITLVENPEIIPGHDARVKKRQEKERKKQLEQDRKTYKDITELAVSMGYPDPGEDGWYGFSVDRYEGVLYIHGVRFEAGTYTMGKDTAQKVLKRVLDELVIYAERRIEKVNRNKQLEQMIDGKPILGERRPWQED